MVHWFKFVLPDSVLQDRQMGKKAYKAAMSWLRYCQREVEKCLDYKELHKAVTNALLYGTDFMTK